MLYSHNTSHSHLSPLPLQNSATSSCQPRATGSPAWLPTNSPEDSTTQLLSRSWSQENPDPSPPPTLPERDTSHPSNTAWYNRLQQMAMAQKNGMHRHAVRTYGTQELRKLPRMSSISSERYGSWIRGMDRLWVRSMDRELTF